MNCHWIDSPAARRFRHLAQRHILVASICEIVEKNGKESIIVTEIPYGVNKAQLIEDIANLMKDGRLDGISNANDDTAPAAAIAADTAVYNDFSCCFISGVTDENGICSFRGFYGEYELEFEVNGKTMKKTVILSSKSDNKIKVVL